MSTYTFVTSDTGRVIERTLVDENNSPIDLSGKSIKIKWKQRGTVQSRDMTKTNEIGGVVQYKQQANDFYPGEVSFEFEITTGAGEIITKEDLEGPFKVRDDL